MYLHDKAFDYVSEDFRLVLKGVAADAVSLRMTLLFQTRTQKAIPAQELRLQLLNGVHHSQKHVFLNVVELAPGYVGLSLRFKRIQIITQNGLHHIEYLNIFFNRIVEEVVELAENGEDCLRVQVFNVELASSEYCGIIFAAARLTKHGQRLDLGLILLFAHFFSV